MLKIIFKFVKKIIVSAFLLYGYNLLVQPIGIVIPINIITVGLITMLGIPAMIALICMIIFIY